MATGLQPNRLIAVSQRVEVLHERGERRDALDQQLVRFILACGYLVIPVPNTLTASGNQGQALALDTWLMSVCPSGVILSGGNDIGDCPERDATEGCLIDFAFRRGLPLLGICRGMQMLAVWAGARLAPTTNHVRTRHRLTVTDPKEAWPETVNSYHNYALDSCPASFHVAARSEDGSIEAIRHETLPWEAWMWHPERESVFSHADLSRLGTLFAPRIAQEISRQ